jgi:bifunctional ADP-heptose synthase (sugar kinase/adenylyltransferase)
MTEKKETPRILPLSALAESVAALRREGKRVVHAHGSFDFVGREDLARLEAARASGQALVVTVAARGAGGDPALLDPALRAQVIASLPFVHAVAICEGVSAPDCARRVGADTFSQIEPAPATPPEPTSGIHVLDATSRADVVYEKREPFSPEAETFLTQFRRRYSTSDVIRALESLKKMRVLVVGDAIIDEYHFVRPYGMPLKAPIIAAQFLEEEAYLGGILAVANHVAGFCKDVHLVTALGAADTREEFIRNGLRSNVKPKFFFRPDAPTTAKRRYLRRFLLQKLFEVAFFDDQPLPAEVDRQFSSYLQEVTGSYDLVVVADFGHGCLSRASIDVLTSRSKFLALNTQLNSVNYGYHVVTKYGRSDYVCIDEEEMRMACRDRLAPIPELLPAVAKQLQAKVVTVTRGHRGSLTWGRDADSMVTIPIFSRQVIDTIGAGDAYLSITAPCVAAGFSPELVGFIGNAVGALAVRIVGNKVPVEPEGLFEFIHVLMGGA